jgi:hypothetical protein
VAEGSHPLICFPFIGGVLSLKYDFIVLGALAGHIMDEDEYGIQASFTKLLRFRWK